MDQGRWRAAVATVAAALVAVVVTGAVVGSRDITRSLEPQVREAVRTAADDPVGVDVRGRDVDVDPGSASDATVERVVAAVRAVPGVHRVRVRPIDVAADPTTRPRDIPLSLRVTPTGVVFASAVPSRALAEEIGTRAAQVRGVPVGVDLAVDATLPQPRWWPGLARVLDATAQVDDLRIEIADGVLEVSGTTTSTAARDRAVRELDDTGVAATVRADVDVRRSGLAERDAAVLETTRIVFAVGSARIDARGEAALADVAAVLRRTDARLDVLGHAGPADPPRGDVLAARRAEAVRDHLVGLGVARSRLVVTAIGSGADRGIDPTSSQYRRVDFRVEEER